MNKKHYKLNFYGIMTYDTVFLVKDLLDFNSLNNCYCCYRSYGGIANCVKWISGLDESPLFNIYINNRLFCGTFTEHFDESSQAVVIISPTRGTKMSFVKWNTDLCFEFESADWTHIMYVDVLTNLKKMDILKCKKNGGILSIDFCLNSINKENIDRILMLIEHIDYLFISDNECYSYAADIQSCMNLFSKAGNVLLHLKEGCYYFEQDKSIAYLPNKVISGINILGAGDVFAASFIVSKMLNPNNLLKDNIISSSKSVLNLYEKEKNYA